MLDFTPPFMTSWIFSTVVLRGIILVFLLYLFKSFTLLASCPYLTYSTLLDSFFDIFTLLTDSSESEFDESEKFFNSSGLICFSRS